MAGPTPAQLGAVRTLIETAPDHALRSLQAALAGAAAGPMGDIRSMIEVEQSARGLRDAVLSPVMPLFGPPGALGGPRFPKRVCTVLWSELKRSDHDLVEEARVGHDGRYSDDPIPPAFDQLCARAAGRLRATPAAFFRGDDGARLAEQLAAFFDLAAIARVVLARLPEWFGKATDERIAQLKLLFKDAVEVTEDATPRLLELTLAHLPEPHKILRLVAALTDHANDRYLASSELATFGERLLADVEGRIAAVKSFDAAGGAAAAQAAADNVNFVGAVLGEIEEDIGLSRDGPWGARVAAARKALAASVESRLRDVESQVAVALPLQTVRIAGRMTRPAPKLGADPAPLAVDRARALVVFLDKVRGAASAGGYGALRNAVADKIAERMNIYADEALHAVNAGEAPDTERALRFVEIAAEFLSHAEDPKAAQSIRRRAAVAGAGGIETSQGAA
ncbi:MAG TPA: hypothetical protein VG407_15520 [Caulobacteraceae bacterium]|jgi:hypothetical protein|nr:hypothetical protein [Caulobacteraceae bacterium]